MKRRLRRACAQCQKAHASCDQDRPCGRCVKYNITSLCFDTELKKRGRKPGSAANKAKAAANIDTTDIEEGVFPLDLNDHQGGDDGHAHGTQTADDFEVDVDEDDVDDVDVIQYPHPRGDTQLLRPTLRDATHALTVRQPTKPIRENDIRALIDQIKELKANQKILREEIRALKDDQMMNGDNSSGLLLSTSPSRRPLLMQNGPSVSDASASSSSAIESTGSTEEISDKAWVIYDLTKLPPTVRTANSTFCKMLGYEMNEVIGQPWKKFVHPDYYERALQILSARRTNGSLHQPIEFEQVYVHKNGGVFLTIDSHTIVILEGQPVSDVVSIRLAPAPAKSSAASGSSKAGAKPAVRGGRGSSKALQDAHELPITPKRTAPKSARTSSSTAASRAQREQPVFDDSDVVRSRRGGGVAAPQSNGDDEFSEYAQRKLENLTLNNGRPTRSSRNPASNSNVFTKSSSSSVSSSASSGLRKPPPRSAKRAAVEVIQNNRLSDEEDTEPEPQYASNAPPVITTDDVIGGHHQQHPDSVLGAEHPMLNGGGLLTDTSASSTTNLTNGLSAYEPIGSLSAVPEYPSVAPASPSSALFNFETDLPWLNDVVSTPPLASATAAGSSSLSLLSPPAPTLGSTPHATSSPLRVGLKESADELNTSFNIDDVLSGFLDDQSPNIPPNVPASNVIASPSSSGLVTGDFINGTTR